jgi:hypothetical protein
MIPLFKLADFNPELVKNLTRKKEEERAGIRDLSVKGRIKFLEANLAKAMLISETLWEFIKENHGLSDEQLREKV